MSRAAGSPPVPLAASSRRLADEPFHGQPAQPNPSTEPARKCLMPHI